MSELAATFGASKAASTLLVLFIPSHDRAGQPINQDQWVQEALVSLGTLFGGGTAFPRGRGVWRDDAQQGQLHFDEPVIIQCYTSAEVIERQVEPLREFLVRMGIEAKQGAIGLVIDRDYLELRFPLPDHSGN